MSDYFLVQSGGELNQQVLIQPQFWYIHDLELRLGLIDLVNSVWKF